MEHGADHSDTLAYLLKGQRESLRETDEVSALLAGTAPDADEDGYCAPDVSAYLDTAYRLWGAFEVEWPQVVRDWFIAQHSLCAVCHERCEWPDTHRECDDAAFDAEHGLGVARCVDCGVELANCDRGCVDCEDALETAREVA